MKKRNFALIYIFMPLLILGMGIAIGTLFSGKTRRVLVQKENTSAMEAVDLFQEYVSTAEGTEPEMLKADYWFQDNPDQVLFSSKEIADFNDNNPREKSLVCVDYRGGLCYNE